MTNAVYEILCQVAGIFFFTLMTIGVVGSAICLPLVIRENRIRKEEREANRPLPNWIRRMS